MTPEEQSEKTESCLENLWNEIQLKGLYRQKYTQEQNKKRSEQARFVYERNKPQHPHRVKMTSAGTVIP